METVIKRASAGQYEEVRQFYHALNDAMAEGPAYVAWTKDVYPAPEFLKQSAEKGELFLLYEEKQIAGAMVFNHDCNDSYAKYQWQTEADPSQVMVIHALGVHPVHSGKGCGKAMVKEAIRMAADSGMKAIRLDVLEGNIPAEKLYTGLGFQYITTLEMFYEDTGWKNFNLYEYVI